MEKRDWYNTPLYYDIIYDAGSRTEGGFLDHAFKAHAQIAGSGKRRLLEPACGSGRLAAEMARRGWEVHGFDANPQTLEFARKRLNRRHLRARLWEDRMECFQVPKSQRYEMVHCLINTFRYLLTENDAAEFLRRAGLCLKPGGILVLGLHLTDYQRSKCEHERWEAERGGVKVVCNTRTWPADARKRLERLRTRLQVWQHGKSRRIETWWDYRTYNTRQLKGLLRRHVPLLRLVACHDFHCDPGLTCDLADGYQDKVLVLRKDKA